MASNARTFVHRGCKGSVVNKAEWSAFDCTQCKEFRQLYHDQPTQCPYGYVKFKSEDLCFKIFYEKKNWHDAYKTCTESSSYMLDVPYENDIDNIDSLWLSFKYFHGQIQGFGKKPINLKALHSHKEEILFNGMIRKSHELHCISAVKEISGFKFQLENCSLEMPFVCVKKLHELVSSTKFASTWIKVSKKKNVESCYYFESSLYSWAETTEFCEQMFYDAKLLNGIQDMDSFNDLKKLIIDQQHNETECSAITWWMNFENVIEQGMPSDLTYVNWSPSVDFSINEPHGVITLFPDKNLYWSLEKPHKKLRVICEIQECQDDRPTQAYIENRSTVGSNESELLNWFHTYHLKCVPSGWFVTDSISWYKDDILLPILSDELTFHHITNISDQTLEYQGYYSCSVDIAESKETIYSSKHLFRIPGIHTFVLSMLSKDKMYLDDCPKYMLRNVSYEDTTLYECFTQHFKDSLNTINSSFALKKLLCNSTHVDIKIHLYFVMPEEEEIFAVVQNADFENFCKACSIDSKSIIAQSTALCYWEESVLKNTVLRWPTTEIGKSSFPDKLCLTDDGKIIERKCTGDFYSGATWSDVSLTECRNTDSYITRELFDLWISGDFTDSVSRLPNLTANAELLQPSDIQLTVEILGSFASQEIFPSDKLYEVVKTISNIIDASLEVIAIAANSSNRVIGYFEKIASNIDEEYADKNISTKNVHVNIYSLNSDKLGAPNCVYILNSSTSFIFNASAEDLESNIENFESGIVLPNSLLQEKSNVTDRVVYSVFNNINYQENISVLSVVISASLHNVPVYDLEKKEVTLLFKLNRKLDKSMQKHVKCVFWDDNVKTWSYKGCFLRNSTQDSILCACNHLTSFTVIMIESIPRAHERPLKYITYVGCSLSCIGFGIIMLTFICFREWRKSLKNKCLFNFSLSHFLFLVIYMAGINKTDSRVLCEMTAIFLHYFLLSSFAWMIVLAYSVYLSLVKVFATYIPCMIQKAIGFAWGLPAIIVIIILSCNHKYYSGEKLCWLSHDASTYGIMIPLILMLIINYIIFGTILYLNTCGTKYVACNQEKRKLIITRAKALLCTSILLGLSWIFGFFAMGTKKNSQIFFMYLFNFTTTFQGFLLAVFFIFRPKFTRQLWMKLLVAPAVSFKSHTSNLNSTVTDHNRINSRYENVMYGVVFKARTPYSPYT